MAHWLVKQEPAAYSFTQFLRDKKTAWTGVRNFQARNFLREMAVGDDVFFYHSVTGKEVVGLARVVKTAYPDPTALAEAASEGTKPGDWVCVDLQAIQELPKPVTLEQIKGHPLLKQMALVKQSRLSVMPVKAAEAAALRRLGQS